MFTLITMNNVMTTVTHGFPTQRKAEDAGRRWSAAFDDDPRWQVFEGTPQILVSRAVSQ